MVRDRLEGIPSPGSAGIFSHMQGDPEVKREHLPLRLKLAEVFLERWPVVFLRGLFEPFVDVVGENSCTL